jgi:hypothetical protein
VLIGGPTRIKSYILAALGVSRMKASLSIGRAFLAIFYIILSRAQVVSTKIVSDGVGSPIRKEVLFWEGTIATIDEIANRSGLEAIGFISGDIMNRSIITEKCNFVKAPSSLENENPSSG